MTIVRRRLVLIAGAVLLAGGAASGIAAAAPGSAPAVAPASAPAAVTADTPDPGESATGPDTDTVQQGDQSAPDTGTSATAESSQEQQAAENGPSDGPGGHADASGTVDHQFTGKE
jgi:hypothetical protein